MDSSLQRLQKRKLVQWALAYLAGAFVMFQVMDALAEPLSLSLLVQRAILTLAVVGFFVTLVFAWYHGEKGRQKVSGPELLIVTLLLVVAGAGIAVLGGAEEIAAPAEETAGSTALARFAALNDDRPVIAVLPLANLSADEGNSYLAAGIHEELLRLLSLVRELGVISRTSVLRYAGTDQGIPEIAAELGARYIVEGSVQEYQGQVRIQVQLIDATTDQHLWADRYDRTLTNIFELQSEVAQAIAGALESVVTPEEQERIEARPTQDPLAYDLYLKASELSYFVKEEYDTGIELLRRATLLDPEFALAHTRLSSFFWNGAINHGYPPFDSAVARVDVALEVDPSLPSALAWKAHLLASAGQYEASRAQAQQALALDPSNIGAWTALAASGWWSGERVGGALAGRRGARLDPNGWGSAWNLGMNLMYAEMFEEARLWFERVVDVDSDNMWGLLSLMSIAMSTGDVGTARDYASRMREAGGDNPNALFFSALSEAWAGNLAAAETQMRQVVASSPDMSVNGTPTAQALLFWVMARSGRSEGMEQLEGLRRRRIQQVEAGAPGMDIRSDLTVIASVIGDADEQLRWCLERTGSDGNGTWYSMRDAPWLDRIRDRPEFQAWLQETESRLEAERSELASMGPWTPEAVLGGGTS